MPQISKSFIVSFLVFSAVVATSTAGGAPRTEPLSWCATEPAVDLIALARHDYFQRRVVREREQGRLSLKSAPNVFQVGQVAVLEDDGTVTFPANTFDLEDSSIQFLHRPLGMSAVRSPLGFKRILGRKLNLDDDDSRRVPFLHGFEFPFGDHAYQEVFVNSNGNLTFGARSSELGGLASLVSGPPRIAPLFTDLDPSAATGENGVYVLALPNRVRITWLGVPEFATENSNTVQVTLFDNGRINIAYGGVEASSPVVGVAPFEEGDLRLLDYDTELPLRPLRAAVAERFTSAPEVDALGVVRLFTERFADVYESVFLWLDFPAVTPGFASAVVLQNDARGIGSEVYDFTNLLFPASKNLESFIQMGDLSRFPDDPDEIFLDTASTMTVVGHEFGHRWLARVKFVDEDGQPNESLLGSPSSAHWSFFTDSQGSLMHGNSWVDNGDGSFSATDGAHTRYSPLDRYLMGLAPPGSVPDFFYVANPDEPTSIDSLPVFEATVNGDRVDVSVEDVIAAEGPRSPDTEASPNTFRTAFLVVGLTGQGVSPEAIAKVESYRKRWNRFFREATDDLGTMRTSLFPR